MRLCLKGNAFNAVDLIILLTVLQLSFHYIYDKITYLRKNTFCYIMCLCYLWEIYENVISECMKPLKNTTLDFECLFLSRYVYNDLQMFIICLCAYSLRASCKTIVTCYIK